MILLTSDQRLGKRLPHSVAGLGWRAGFLLFVLFIGTPTRGLAQEAGAKSCLERPEICGKSGSCCEYYVLAEKFKKNEDFKNALAKYSAAFEIQPTAAIKLKLAWMYHALNEPKQFRKQYEEAAAMVAVIPKDQALYRKLKSILDDYSTYLQPASAPTALVSEPPLPVVAITENPPKTLIAPGPPIFAKVAPRRRLGFWTGIGIGVAVTLATSGTIFTGWLVAKQHEYNSTALGAM